MKLILLPLIAFVIFAAPVSAQDKLDALTTTSGKTYKDVTVKGTGVLGISIKHSTGFAKIPFSDLSEEIRKKYNYDPKKARAAAAQQAAATAKRKALQEKALEERKAIQAEKMSKQRASQEEKDKLIAQKRNAKRETYKVIKVTADGVFATIYRKDAGIGLRNLNGGIRISTPQGSKATLVLVRSDEKPLFADGAIVEAMVVDDGTAKYANPEGGQTTIKAFKAIRWIK